MMEWLFSWEVTSVVVGAFAATALAVLAMNDFRLARCFFLAAGAYAAGGIVVWGVRTSSVSVAFLLVGLIGITTIMSFRYVDRKAKSDPTRREASLEEDTELNQINELICKKDEIELRSTFDFPEILKYNIKFAKRNLVPHLVSEGESAEIDTFFLNGNARLDVRYANITTPNNRVQVDWVPGKIGVINMSTKYGENRKKLATLISSATLPSEVTAALKVFEEVIERNSTLMIESLNQSLTANPRNILENDIYGSNWYGSAAGLYWGQFVLLRPKADIVTLAVRKAIGDAKNGHSAFGER